LESSSSQLAIEIDINQVINMHAREQLNFIIATPGFVPSSGGIIALHNLAKTIYEFNIPCKMFDFSGQKLSNEIFDIYATESDINDSTIVVYPEIVSGNPLQAKHVVRWILCELGVHCSANVYLTWGKNDFVYHYSTFDSNKNVNCYNLLSPLCISPDFQDQGKDRNGYCHIIRKGLKFHQELEYIHPVDSLFLADDTSQEILIHIFNTKKYLISYDPYSYVSTLAALCGCISIIVPLKDINKKQWLESLSTSVILDQYGEEDLKGIAYGLTEIEYAQNTLADVKRQQNIFVEYGNNSVKRFINDLANAVGSSSIALDKSRNQSILDVHDVFFSNSSNLHKSESKKVSSNQLTSKELSSYEKPLVSVCIPTYNGQFFIKEALNSIFSQTYPNLEIILSDDNSSDRTVEIAKSFQSQSPHNFSVLEHDQYGLAANWNFCISQAQGKYIKFLFQDDLLQPNAIAEMVNLAEQDQEIGLVFSPRRLITSNSYSHEALFLANHEAKDIHKGWSNLQSIQSGQELLQDLNILEHPINKIGEPSTILIRKEVFDVLGAFNPELCQLVDLEMWLRIMSQYKVGFIDRTLSSFRIHDQQQTKINSASQETLLLDYQRFFHTIITNTLYPQATRQAALYKYEILTGNNLQLSRRQLAEQCLSLKDYQLVDWYQGLSGKLQQTLMQERSENSNLSPEDQQFANGLYTLIEQVFEQPESTRTLLAAMLYYRADKIPLPCDLSKIPDWLLADYLNYLFPKFVAFYQTGESESYYIYMCKWIDYLHNAIFSHPDHPYWHQVVNIFAQIANFIPTNISEHNLKSLYVKRAEIIEFFLKINEHELEYEFQHFPLAKKKIKLGVLVYQNTPSAETFATLPFYEYLSRDFEVFLYTIRKSEGSLTEYCRSCVNHAKLLPSDFEGQINSIREDDLDILFFGANVTAITNQMCLLASHRLARIQVTSGASIATTGLKNMDYFISGTLTDPDQNAQSQYQEKLLQIPGIAHCFSYGNDEVVAQIEVDRSSLNISPETVVFTSGANLFKIVPELFHTWAKIIAQVPKAVLMLLPYGPNWSKSYLKQPFEENLIHIFAEYGLSADQLIILDPQPVPNRADVKAYYQIADIYLDSFPFAGTTSLIEPLQVGLPVIARQGNCFRSAMGAAMIQSLGIADLVATSEESYIQLAVNLGNSLELRQQKCIEVQTKMQNNPSFLDSRAYSEKIGELFIDLFDRYVKNAQNESLQLRDTNLMVFPDWNQSEELVGYELQQVIQTLATQPNAQNTTLLIDTTNIATEDAQMFLSSIAMNIMMEEDLDITEELGISLIEDLNNIQWENLLPRINSRIVMDCDDRSTIDNLLPVQLMTSSLSNLSAQAIAEGTGNIAVQEMPPVLKFAQEKISLPQKLKAPIRLHIGGQEYHQDWKILDALPRKEVDFIGNAKNLSQFANDSISAIYTSHVLEHFHYLLNDELTSTLKEWHRVLEPGGELMVSVPNLQLICSLYVDPHTPASDRYHLMRMIFGGHLDEYDVHKVGFDQDILGMYLKNAGFRDLQVVSEFGLFNDCSSLLFGGVPISLNMIAKK
jgi:predicted O-linked N-acetylglucosamine transferase (SPINDLY family)/predicted SAM-dependent methyltransferase